MELSFSSSFGVGEEEVEAWTGAAERAWGKGEEVAVERVEHQLGDAPERDAPCGGDLLRGKSPGSAGRSLR